MTRTLKILGVNVLVFFGLLFLFEAVGQVIALVRPSYDVLFLQPDEALGWKQVPHLRWIWTGNYWYAADFSVEIETNSLGFRDSEREFPKQHDVKRVALLGDSFIEAVQVPFAKTASQILERRLNASLDRDHGRSQNWEVLNFGISNYGIGQCLLVWEHYVRRFHPDYVVLFVAKFHMKRTTYKYECDAFSEDGMQDLWVRPTFYVENDSLKREPAHDFGEFVKAQERCIKAEFNNRRIRRKRTRLLTVFYARVILGQLENLVRRFIKCPKQIEITSRNAPVSDDVLYAINLKIIEELGRGVSDGGGRLAVLDASKYFGEDDVVSRTLSSFCAENHFGYIPLYEDLLEAERNGVSTRWVHDGHFNEDGNAITADVLCRWIEGAECQTNRNRKSAHTPE